MYKTCSKCKFEKLISHFSCTRLNEDGSCKYYNSWCNACRTENNRLRNGSNRRNKATITETTKQCLKCLILKDFSEFSPSSRGKLQLSSYCKNCSIRASPEKARIYQRNYRSKNRNYYLHLHRLRQFNRKSKIKAAEDGTITKEYLDFLYSQEYCCWCGNFTEIDQRTLEHIIELNNAGLHSVHNTNMACFSCNSKRLNRNNDKMCESLFSKFICKKGSSNDNNC